MTIFYGDTMTIEDTWVEGCGYNNSAFKALFENWSKLILNRMLGVIFPMLPVQPVRRRRSLPALAEWHLLADTAQRGPIPADGLGKRRDDRAHRGELWPLHCQA